MTKTILIVDDEFDLANTLRAILAAEGYQPETYSDGRHALERLVTAELPRPDLVLMDVMMPRVSGLDVLRHMRATPELQGIPVILMSVIRPSLKKAEYRWDAFLHKPFSLQSLVKVVREHTRAGGDGRA